MKHIYKSGKILGLAAAVSMLAGTAFSTAQAESLPKKTQKAILVALDDEYKSWSLYHAILEKHGTAKPFSNIIHAEKRHADALIELLKTYKLPIPKNPYEDGTKEKLVAPDSILQACKEGVQAEIDNIKLYDEKIMPDVKGYATISAVMLRLRNASEERHLVAFKRCVNRDGKMGRGQHGMGGGQGMGRRHGGGMDGGQGMGRE